MSVISIFTEDHSFETQLDASDWATFDLVVTYRVSGDEDGMFFDLLSVKTENGCDITQFCNRREFKSLIMDDFSNEDFCVSDYGDNYYV